MSTTPSSVSIQEMVVQSREIISNPSVSTFERYERYGNLSNAAIYVGVAAIITGVLGLTGGISGLISGILGTVLGFIVFTGMVFWLGKNLAGGTGSWDEVAYTFSLFVAPLAVFGAVLGFAVWLFSFIPILGGLIALLGVLASLAVLVVQIYFSYLAIQSGMNIHDQGKAIVTLVLAAVGSFVVQMVIGGILGGIF